MPDQDNSPSGGRKAVGIYDRPASADRPRLAIWISLIVAILAVLGWYFFLRSR